MTVLWKREKGRGGGGEKGHLFKISSWCPCMYLYLHLPTYRQYTISLLLSGHLLVAMNI